MIFMDALIPKLSKDFKGIEFSYSCSRFLKQNKNVIVVLLANQQHLLRSEGNSFDVLFSANSLSHILLTFTQCASVRLCWPSLIVTCVDMAKLGPRRGWPVANLSSDLQFGILSANDLSAVLVRIQAQPTCICIRMALVMVKYHDGKMALASLDGSH